MGEVSDQAAAALRRELDELRGRVDALEAGGPTHKQPPSHRLDTGLLESLAELGDPTGPGPSGGIAYAGALRLGESQVAWQQVHGADELPSAFPELPSIAAVIAALASPNRLRILLELLAGRLQSSDLQARLDEPTVGGLYHHLRELLAARLVTQPKRSQYEIPPAVIVPLLTILACGSDLVSAVSAIRDEG
jgi:DNA-binding transcriptional ArsR family regulator